MNRVTSVVAASLIAIVLSLVGYAATAMQMTDEHSAMMGQSSADCVSICLTKGLTNQVLPAIIRTELLLNAAVTQILSLVLPALLALIFSLYAARPRPSPNLIALHTNYLE